MRCLHKEANVIFRRIGVMCSNFDVFVTTVEPEYFVCAGIPVQVKALRNAIVE